MNEKKYILITGIAGLIGSRLAEYILKNHPEYGVVGIDDLSGGYRENVPYNAMLFIQDVANPSIDLIFQKYKPEYVYHCSAYACEGLSPFIRNYNYQNNLISTANIITHCIKYNVKRLIFTSSMSVYGHGNPPFSEEDRQSPIDPYGIAKYACEMDIQVAGTQHNLDWCIIRPHNVYGKNQNIWDKYRNVLGIWMYQHLNGMEMTIFGDGEQKRAFSYIDDCLEPLWKASMSEQASKQIINLGGIHEYSINEANSTLREVMGGGNVVHKEARHEVKYAFPTFQKSVDILGFEHKHNLKEGLTKMWEWSKKQPMKERFVWSKYELEKGIYEFWKK